VGLRIWQHGAEPIGIDVGSWGVKLLQLRRGRAGWQVVAAGKEPYRECLSEDPTEQREMISRAVRTVLSRGRFQGSDCVSCLSPNMSLVRAVRLPKMDDKELSQAVVWEAAERFNLEHGDFEVDWVRAGEVSQGDDVRQEVILIASRTVDLETHLDALIDCHLRPIAVESSLTGVVRSFTRHLRRQSDMNVSQMIADVGSDGTSIIITRGLQIAFVKSIAIGGRAMTEAVTDSLGIEPDVATQIRHQRMHDGEMFDEGLSSSDQRYRRAILDAVRPLLHELASEAALCLRYYGVTFRSSRPSVALVAGGDAKEPQFIEILADHLNIETRIAHPLEGVEMSAMNLAHVGNRRETEMPEWVTAMGLSLRGREQTISRGSRRRLNDYTSRKMDGEAA